MGKETTRVLIIDDDEEEFIITRELLSRVAGEDYRLAWESCGPSGIRAIESGDHDICLLDYALGSDTGLDVLREVRHRGFDIPVILLTGHGNDQIDRQASQDGAADYLEKGAIDARLLGRAIRYGMSHRREMAALQTLATIDKLTGLPNRREFDRLIEAEANRCRRSDTRLAFALVDVDHFKSVNDTYGHSIGDQVLKWLAARLAENVRSVDCVARYGGEEFAVIMPETSADVALDVTERLRAKIAEQPASCSGVDGGRFSLPLTVSVGVSVFPSHSDRIDVLVHFADEALYQAKRGGRNRVAMYECNARARTLVPASSGQLTYLK